MSADAQHPASAEALSPESADALRAGPSAADIRHVTALVRDAGTSFYHGMKVLPPARRDAMYGIYAFCRVVDDIADDDDVPMARKRAALQAWRERIARVYAGVPEAGSASASEAAVARVLAAAVRDYGLKERDFIAVIDGMEMDGEAIVAPPMPVLDLYCDRVAAAVGRLSVRVFGDAGPAAQEVAGALGRALQLTNILRDVREDSRRGRLYFPHEVLRDAAVPETPDAALASPNLPQAARAVAAMADAQFAAAAAAMRRCDRRAMRPARLMAASYRPILAEIRRRRYDVTGPRVSLPKWRKLMLAARLLLP